MTTDIKHDLLRDKHYATFICKAQHEHYGAIELRDAGTVGKAFPTSYTETFTEQGEAPPLVGSRMVIASATGVVALAIVNGPYHWLLASASDHALLYGGFASAVRDEDPRPLIDWIFEQHDEAARKLRAGAPLVEVLETTTPFDVRLLVKVADSPSASGYTDVHVGALKAHGLVPSDDGDTAWYATLNGPLCDHLDFVHGLMKDVGAKTFKRRVAGVTE
jgi:hypothetical protein